jgi:hypothetical protein
MRLWTIHPKYLDPRGLTALWREALLARTVLRGETTGYRNHPQLERFRAHPAPHAAINTYLAIVHAEACARGYSFDATKLEPDHTAQSLPATSGQISYEWEHLLRKLLERSPQWHAGLRGVTSPDCNPLFLPCKGAIESWERRSQVRSA